MEADLYLASHRERWVECVTAYVKNGQPGDPNMRQSLGLEVDAGIDGIRDANAQLKKLEKTFGKAALQAYLKGEGYGAAVAPQ